jgi:uncharacterized membrane protein (DUF106 family)
MDYLLYGLIAINALIVAYNSYASYKLGIEQVKVSKLANELRIKSRELDEYKKQVDFEGAKYIHEANLEIQRHYATINEQTHRRFIN